MAQNPTEAQSVSTMLPLGFLPFFAWPIISPRAVNSRSNAALTSALSFAEQDLPEQTNTWCRMGAAVTGARARSSSGSAMNLGSATMCLGDAEAASRINEAVFAG